MPGTSGLVAAKDGSILQVQGDSTQTAVLLTATTRITKTVTGKASDVVVGACVSVRSATASSSPAPTAASTVVASTVTVTAAAAGGACTLGAGAGPGGGGPPPAGGFGGTPPSGVPTVRPSGAPGAGRPGGFGGFGGTTGKVTSVGAGTFVVSPVTFAPPGASAAPATASPVTVTTSAATTYSRVVSGKAPDVVVGTCVTARGSADSTGRVTATALTVRPAVNGVCSSGRGAPGSTTGSNGG